MERSIRPLGEVFDGFSKLHRPAAAWRIVKTEDDQHAQQKRDSQPRSSNSISDWNFKRTSPWVRYRLPPYLGPWKKSWNPPRQGEPERAQILIEGADHSYQEIRNREHSDRRKRRRGALETWCQRAGYGSK